MQRQAKLLMEWAVSHWEDNIFSGESRFSFTNDSCVQRVWQTKSEAEKPLFICL